MTRPTHPLGASLPPFALVSPERITVCTRPFRALGPRIEPERLGSKLIIHNYGHGGSGWSLSWGSAAEALAHATAAGLPASLAVIGAGALGLTTAVAALRMGLPVTIYTRDLPQDTRSARATGAWTPDSRVALASAMPPGFPAAWERLARHSWQSFQPYLHAPGAPLEFQPRFILTGGLTPDAYQRKLHADDPIGFAWLNPRLADLYQPPIDLLPNLQPNNPASTRLKARAPSPRTPIAHEWDPAPNPFPTQHVRREHQLIFNLTEYTRQLHTEFLSRGGRLVQRQFHTAADLLTLPEPVLIHCTGFGARQLFADESLIPVRGQITWLPPQPEANYSLFAGDAHQHLNLVSRRDGLVVQWSGTGESTGWNNPTESPDQTESTAALEHFSRFTGP